MQVGNHVTAIPVFFKYYTLSNRIVSMSEKRNHEPGTDGLPRSLIVKLVVIKLAIIAAVAGAVLYML